MTKNIFIIATACVCISLIGINTERSIAISLSALVLIGSLIDCRVWMVRYNHFHDQLVLTSSSDSRVILNNVASISSEPYGHLLEDEAEDDDDDDMDKK